MAQPRVSRVGCYDGRMTNYKTGAVARLKVHGKEATAVRYKDGWAFAPDVDGGIAGTVGYCDDTYGKFTDIRPLVVLDPTDWPAQWNAPRYGKPILRHWAGLANEEGLTAVGGVLNYLADQIEAQTKPTRIPEPGLWGVVKADGDIWVRMDVKGYQWRNEAGTDAKWEDLDDPVLIREGVGE